MNNLWDAVTNELDEVKEDNERLRRLLDRLLEAIPGVAFDSLVDNETELMDTIREELADD